MSESKVRRLLPIGSTIQDLHGEQYHLIKFYYLPNAQMFESIERHKMGECKHCKIWTPVKKEVSIVKIEWIEGNLCSVCNKPVMKDNMAKQCGVYQHRICSDYKEVSAD